MNIINFKASLIAVLLAAALAGCSNGSSDSGGTGGTGVTTGTVTATSDVGPGVVVNGVSFNESNATIIINDSTDPGAHGGIKVGMTVKIRGSNNGTAGTATDIEVEHAVEGTVTSTNGVDTLTVLGQTVMVSGQTLYEPAGTTFASLIVGTTKIEVYGLRDQDNVIRATLIEVEGDSDFEEELRGTISGLDTNTSTFVLNGVTVRYNVDTIFDDGSIGDLANGQTVEVHFNNAATSNYLATEIEFEDIEDSEFQVSDGSEFEIEGYVTSVGFTTFEIGSQTVQTNPSTVYNDPNTFSNIVVGARVQVDGVISGSVLVADEIDIQ